MEHLEFPRATLEKTVESLYPDQTSQRAPTHLSYREARRRVAQAIRCMGRISQWTSTADQKLVDGLIERLETGKRRSVSRSL